MVAQTAQEAKDRANRQTRCIPGYCLQYTRTWLDIPSRDGSAAVAWSNALGRHPGDRTPPAGAPMFWLGGSRGYGHIALSMNGTEHTFRGTDMPGPGVVSTQDNDWISTHWSSMSYAGWAEGFNGILIPYLSKPESEWASGDVYVSKLHHGVQDSDSVARLCYRLRHHEKMQGSGHKPPHQVRNYGDEIVEAVRYWQRNVMAHDVKGPTDGTSLSNPQANRLFTDAYHVIEK